MVRGDHQCFVIQNSAMLIKIGACVYRNTVAKHIAVMGKDPRDEIIQKYVCQRGCVSMCSDLCVPLYSQVNLVSLFYVSAHSEASTVK